MYCVVWSPISITRTVMLIVIGATADVDGISLRQVTLRSGGRSLTREDISCWADQ